jgi:hypothetical protein
MYTLLLTLHFVVTGTIQVVPAYFENEEACNNAKVELVSAYGAYGMSSTPTQVVGSVCINGKYGTVE